MANYLSRADENAMRLMGRQMAESSVRNVSSTTDSAGSTVYRETGRVITVYEDGRLDINLGDDWNRLIVESVPYTTACTGVQVDDTVIIETFGHRMVAVGIVATSSDPQYRPATQEKVDEVDGKADSAISKADENAADIIAAQKSVEEAASKADDAVSKAQNATDAAAKAQTAASAAQASADTASSAASEAKTKADDAAAKITVIEGNITEIEAASKDAKDAADKAQTTADAANEAASKANESIAETNKQVTNIADEMATVKEDATKTRDELSEKIQTVTDTMTADYAKKTELSETESSLKTEISKSAAGVLSEVSSTYSTKVELDKTTATAEDAKAKAEANTTDLANAVTKFDKDVSDLQTQIDGSIQTWFYDGEPSSTTEPESEWTSDTVRNTHLGDLYYDNKTGFCYRYLVQDGVYSWSKIQDTEVTKALSDAAKAQETANAKKRIFVVQPVPPYDEGDLWVQGESGEIMRCNVAKIEGQEYAETDWGKASKYTDDSSVLELANTVEKTYATKSSVTQLSDRIEQTVSAVETVKVDAAAAQAKADEASAAAKTAQETADTAKSNAATAQSKADDAATAAANAQEAADTAKTDASTAQTAADNAKKAAADAATAASAAQEKANTAAADAATANEDLAVAKKNLEAVQNQANATDTQVAAAQAAVVKAQQAADKANEAATTAQDAADAAKTTADAAKENAATAQTTADAAKESAVNAATAAETAKTDAAKAQETADTANATANTAQTNAANAQADADKANAAIEDLTGRVTTAETSIKQNADAIELKASKTELEDGVADAKSYSDSQLSVKADEITADVKTAQGGVDTLETLVRVYGEGVEVAKKVDGAYTSSRAVVTDSAFSIVAQDGTTLARYGKTGVDLGMNSQSSSIGFCSSKGRISYHVATDSSDEYLSIMAPYGAMQISGVGYVMPGGLGYGRSIIRIAEGSMSVRPHYNSDLYLGRTDEGQQSYIHIGKMNGKIELVTPEESVYIKDTAVVTNLGVNVTGSVVATKGIQSNLSVTTPTVTSTGAMTIKANNASSNVTLNNTVFGNNTMNTTTAYIDNLYWDSTLLGGRVGVKLWSGTLSKGGSITVNNLNRYRVLVVVTDYNEGMLCANRNDSIYLSADGSVDNGTTTYLYRATFTKNSNTGTTLTLRSASRHEYNPSMGGEVIPVKIIYGLI